MKTHCHRSSAIVVASCPSSRRTGTAGRIGRSGGAPTATASRARPASLQQWPAGGPPVVWTASGLGAATARWLSAATACSCRRCAAGRAWCTASNVADGKYIWSKNLGAGGDNDRGSGPRGTPTVDGDRLYVLTEGGELACLRAADATVVWQRNILRDFAGSNINWLISESPLVDGDRVIVTPGGREAPAWWRSTR